MVYEIMPAKKLDIKGIHDRKICPYVRNIIKAIFERENPYRVVINPPIILLVDFRRVFYHIKRSDNERFIRNSISIEITSTMDLTTTIQHKFIIVNVNNINVHKKMLQIIKRLSTIYLCLFIESVNQQNCKIYCWQMLLNNDGFDTILSLAKTNQLWVGRKNDTGVQKLTFFLLHI